MEAYRRPRKFVIQGLDSHLCNQRCDFCYVTFEEDHLDLGRQKSYLSKDQYRMIADKVIEYLVQDDTFEELVVTGGESTISPDIFRIYEAVGRARPDMKFHIVSNGLHFGKKWENLLYPRGHKVAFNVSLNASCDEVYKRHHRRGDFGKVDANIRKLVNDKTEGKHDMVLSASMVVTSRTVDDIFQFYRYCCEAGLDASSYRFNTDPITGSSLIHHLTPEGLATARREILKLKAYRKIVNPWCHLNDFEALEAFFEFAEACAGRGEERPVVDAIRSLREGVVNQHASLDWDMSSYSVSEACQVAGDVLISFDGSVGVCCLSNTFFGYLLGEQSLGAILNSATRTGYLEKARCGTMVGCRESCATLQSLLVTRPTAPEPVCRDAPKAQ